MTDEESVELWLVEKEGKNTQSGRRREGDRSRDAAFMRRRWQGVQGWVGVAQFVNAITVDLPSLTTESNQHCGGNSSA